MVKKRDKELAKEIFWLIRDKYKNKEDKDKIALDKDLNRLKIGEPLDYVIGWKDFLGCHIDLSFRPLIPREETAFWVEKILKEINKEKQSKKISCLDLFAGSGCVGLAVLKNLPGSKMVFADKSQNSLEQIKINLRFNKINSRRTSLIKTDVWSRVEGKFDLIFANPPYIADKEKRIQKSVLVWEPKNALYGGEDGLDFIRKFLLGSRLHLKTGGKIFMEFGIGQKGHIEKILKSLEYTKFDFFKDQFGRWRWVAIS